MRIKCSDKHERLVQEFVDSVAVSLDSNNAVISKCACTVAQQPDGTQNIGHNERLEDIQLKVAVASSNRNGNVIAHNLSSDHCNGFTLGGIYFTLITI